MKEISLRVPSPNNSINEIYVVAVFCLLFPNLNLLTHVSFFASESTKMRCVAVRYRIPAEGLVLPPLVPPLPAVVLLLLGPVVLWLLLPRSTSRTPSTCGRVEERRRVNSIERQTKPRILDKQLFLNLNIKSLCKGK